MEGFLNNTLRMLLVSSEKFQQWTAVGLVKVLPQIIDILWEER